MSQFFVYRCQSADSAEVVGAAASHTHAIAAIAKAGNKVILYNEEGEIIGQPLQRDCRPNKLSWHPKANLLLVGWADGLVQSIQVSEEKRFEDAVVHAAPITMVQWSPDGSRLLTGDSSGLLAVWETSQQGRFTVLQRYQKTGAITRAAFFPTPVSSETPGLPGSGTPSESRLLRFFFGGESGAVFFADDAGHCTEALPSLNAPIDVMALWEESNRLVVITSSLLMTHLQVDPDGKLTPVLRAKISMRTGTGVHSSVWAGRGVLATSSPDENLVRFWDFASDDNYTVALTGQQSGVPRSDRVGCLSFDPLKSVLAVGTVEGRILLFRFQPSPSDSESDSGPHQWVLAHILSVGSSVRFLDWSSQRGLLACGLTSTASVVAEIVLGRKLVNGVAVLQTSARDVVVEQRDTASEDVITHTLRSSINIKGLDATDSNLVVHNQRMVEVFAIPTGREEQPRLLGSLFCHPLAVGLFGDTVFVATRGQLQCYNFSGTVKHTIPFTDLEGDPAVIATQGRMLAVGTTNGVIKVLDVGRVEPKVLHSGRFEDSRSGKPIGRIVRLAVNCDGSKVAAVANRIVDSPSSSEPTAEIAGTGGPTNSSGQADSRVLVFFADTGGVASYDAGPERIPLWAAWDAAEPKLLAVQTERLRLLGSAVAAGGGEAPATGDSSSAKVDDNDEAAAAAAARADFGSWAGGSGAVQAAPKEVLTFFASPEGEILLQDSVPVESPMEALLGVAVPALYFTTRSSDEISRVGARTLRDFVGLEDADVATKDALLEFSYHLAAGNMDAAFRAVRVIENPTVWRNMAFMCVQSRRLDVAEVCLAHMGHVRGVRAVREAKRQEPELEARVAMVGIQLGLLGDAAQLYQEVGRFDLLNKLFQSSGEWERALAVASSLDRVHASTTHFLYAKHLESMGELARATEQYELAGTARKDVPRMLVDRQEFQGLKQYVAKHTDDSRLVRWMGQYAESSGNIDVAARYYREAGDFLSLVRLLCAKGDFRRAAELVHESNSKAAAFHLARQLAAQGHATQSIRYFELAGRYSHAVRVAMEAGDMDTELMTMALRSEADTMRRVAQHFERTDQIGRAVQLYHRAGEASRALDLCFEAQMFDDLREIAQDLGSDTPPATLRRVADFFITHNQFEKAVDMLVTARQYDDAVELAAAHRVHLSEQTAEAMTPPKEPPSDCQDTAQYATRRQELLVQLARLLKKQGDFHLATKKYTQAGDRLRAMRCLLKSGDTEKIIFFASVSRNRDIYVLAANHLQALNWREDPNIMKNIVSFYTKARAFDKLSSFFEACAQVEIDEYRNYEKAAGAMREALKAADKIRSAEREATKEDVQRKLDMVERFTNCRSLATTDPQQMVDMCHQLLENRDPDLIVRPGDVFALLVEYYFHNGNIEQAYHLVESMKQRGIHAPMYLDEGDVTVIYREMGVDPRQALERKQPATFSSGGGQVAEPVPDELDDEVEEELDFGGE